MIGSWNVLTRCCFKPVALNWRFKTSLSIDQDQQKSPERYEISLDQRLWNIRNSGTAVNTYNVWTFIVTIFTQRYHLEQTVIGVKQDMYADDVIQGEHCQNFWWRWLQATQMVLQLCETTGRRKPLSGRNWKYMHETTADKGKKWRQQSLKLEQVRWSIRSDVLTLPERSNQEWSIAITRVSLQFSLAESTNISMWKDNLQRDLKS